MEAVLKEAIEVLKKQKRPELIDVTVYGRYSNRKQTYLYNDSEEEYQLHRSTPDDKTVRSVKAFVEIIKEELLRRENETGQNATVKINLEGGYFIPDDDFGEEMIKFSRLNSQQWNLIKGGINKVYNHREFLKFLRFGHLHNGAERVSAFSGAGDRRFWRYRVCISPQMCR